MLALKCKGRHKGKVKIYLNEINKGHDGFSELDTIYSVVSQQFSQTNMSNLIKLENLSFGRPNLFDSLNYYFFILFKKSHLKNWTNYYQTLVARFEILSRQLLLEECTRETLINLAKYPSDHFISYILNLFSGRQFHVQYFINLVLLEQHSACAWNFYTNIDIDYVSRNLLKKDIELVKALKVFERCKREGVGKEFATSVPSFINFKRILI